MIRRCVARFSSSSSLMFAKKSGSTNCARSLARVRLSSQLQASCPRIRPVPAPASRGAIEPLVLEAASGSRTNQVLRLRRTERGLRAAFFRRLGDARSPGLAAGYGTLTLPATRPARAKEAGARCSRRWSSLSEWLSEDYFIFHVREIDRRSAAAQLLHVHGGKSRRSCAARLPSFPRASATKFFSRRISYYPNDLAVIGWNAAFLYDTKVGAETAIQLLEYANSQLLEFRHYDELLTRELDDRVRFPRTRAAESSLAGAGPGGHRCTRSARCGRTD